MRMIASGEFLSLEIVNRFHRELYKVGMYSCKSRKLDSSKNRVITAVSIDLAIDLGNLTLPIKSDASYT